MQRPEVSRSGALQGALLRLIADADLRIVFQPIIRLDELRVIGLEALSRPGRGSVFASAEEMFTAGEATGLLTSLESVARREVLRSVSGWPADTLLFLNVSPSALADPSTSEQILGALERTPALRPESLVIEITEQSSENALVRCCAQRLRRMGFGIALDDLGAGAQDLQRVVDLSPDWIKIDRHLVRGVQHDPNRRRLLGSLAGYARQAGARVIAEGIEHADELVTLRDLGVGYAQGFLLARPSCSFHAAARIATRQATLLAA